MCSKKATERTFTINRRSGPIREDKIMKIKRFNVIVAAVVLGGALLAPSAISAVGKTLWRPVEAAVAVQQSVGRIIAGDKTASAAFTSEGKEVTTMSWRSRNGDLPGKTTLKKWVAGDRTYYEISGPINPQFSDLAADSKGHWGNYFACEVFFERGGSVYDQWIINPVDSFMYHYSAPSSCGSKGRTGSSHLSDSRYQVRVEGDRTFITFWCKSSDTPRNIVFNYNNPSAPGKLNWVTTHEHQQNQHWNHHDPALWTDL
jgi:hypothetical protein